MYWFKLLLSFALLYQTLVLCRTLSWRFHWFSVGSLRFHQSFAFTSVHMWFCSISEALISTPPCSIALVWRSDRQWACSTLTDLLGSIDDSGVVAKLQRADDGGAQGEEQVAGDLLLLLREQGTETASAWKRIQEREEGERADRRPAQPLARLRRRGQTGLWRGTLTISHIRLTLCSEFS